MRVRTDEKSTYKKYMKKKDSDEFYTIQQEIDTRLDS